MVEKIQCLQNSTNSRDWCDLAALTLCRLKSAFIEAAGFGKSHARVDPRELARGMLLFTVCKSSYRARVSRDGKSVNRREKLPERVAISCYAGRAELCVGCVLLVAVHRHLRSIC
ncbi:hypothetical protein RRG08_003144 [Elysia crispata]|uniref:Uncharacterized protein n=1 Tax=Elysia crispata TaxID=231223 RepID=A0AAE1B6G2_9GAST|nr:hypothetical protein RRG08_003144 [Elysia crispata]